METTKVYRIYDEVNYEDYNLDQIKKMIESEEIKLIFQGDSSKYNFVSHRQLNDDLDDLGYCFWNSSDQKEEVNRIKLLISEEQNEQLTTVIITVKSKITGAQILRDAQELSMSDLISVINRYIENEWEIIAIEELDETVDEFYSKRMSDDDIDAMAEEAVEEYYNKPIVSAIAMDIPE